MWSIRADAKAPRARYRWRRVWRTCAAGVSRRFAMRMFKRAPRIAMALPRLLGLALAAMLAIMPPAARAGAQVEEELSANVQNSLHRSVSDYPAPHLVFANDVEGLSWLADMSSR